MHELTLMQRLVEVVEAQGIPDRVRVVRLVVGRLTCVRPHALRFCFDACVRGTTLQGAALEVEDVPGRIRCRACGAEDEVDAPLLVCACGSADVQVLTGDELRVRELEVG